MKNKVYKMNGRTIWLYTYDAQFLDGNTHEYQTPQTGFSFVGTADQFDFMKRYQEDGWATCIYNISRRHPTAKEYEAVLNDY